MLNCVYHPIDDMRVVDNEEREKLLASGAWFDSPLEAKALRDKHEHQILNDPKPRKQKAKPEDRDHEKRSEQ